MDGSPLGSLGSVQPRAWLQFHRRLVCGADPPPALPRVSDSCSPGVGAITSQQLLPASPPPPRGQEVGAGGWPASP